jgi:hypothetical protein
MFGLCLSPILSALAGPLKDGASGSNQTLETRNTCLDQRRMAAATQDSNVGFLPPAG